MIAMIAKQGLQLIIIAAGLSVALICSLAAASALAEEPILDAVALRVSDVKHEPAGKYGQFTYTREFHDLAGLGAKLRHGRVCYSSGGCISAPLEYVIEPGGVLMQEGQFLMPMSISQAFDFTYTGENGDGDEITVKARILVVGDQLELQELE
tara:strand:- start:69 stop:527 length:459 start_codon:yes stop_codon:yes gene_type:complete